MTRIKICGIREVEHALAAAEAGADYLGLVFATSKRQISPEKAAELISVVKSSKWRPLLVGVFAGEHPNVVNDVARKCGLDWVQLSGGETWQYCKKINKPFLKAIHVPKGEEPEVLYEIERGYSLSFSQRFICLLDTQSAGLAGGTGKVFDWKIARQPAKRFPLMIAGGLTPENVGRLVRHVRPFGVDVSSGVEINGVKSVERIKAFIAAVRSADKGEEKNAGNNEERC